MSTAFMLRLPPTPLGLAISVKANVREANVMPELKPVIRKGFTV